MSMVLTPDGWGQVLNTESAYGRTSYLIKGAGFEGWYDGLEVTADFADQPEDVIPNEENDTALPYPSAPQGPGWDGTTSTIEPGIDPHIEMGHASDSLSGESTDEDPVKADIEGLFEPHSRLAGRGRRHRVHFAQSSDLPILDVDTIPDDSPVGLDNSPINPDNVDTDDLFDGSLPHFERSSSYDRLVIEDELAFMRYAADDDSDSDDDDKKKNHHERDGISGFPKDDDDDDDSDNDSDSDDDSSDGGDSDSGGDGGDGGGSHTAAVAFALSTTADLHFLANMCSCDESIPLHSKSEHRELVAEGGLKSRRKKGDKGLGSKPLTGQHDEKHGPKSPTEAGYTKTHGISEVLKKKKQGERKLKVERPIKHATPNDVEAQPRDLEEYEERYRQDQHFHPAPLDLVDHSLDDGDSADLWNHYSSIQHTAEEGEHDKYIGSNGDGTYHLIASGNGKLPKGQQYGHYDSLEAARHALRAIEERNHALHISSAGEGGVHAPYKIEKRNGRYHVVNAKGESKEAKGYATEAEARQHQKALYANVPGAAEMAKQAAPAQQDAQPTQIESQIEQLMQFWAVDNNGWWHWTGSQADLALLNQMQQQMMAVGMPGGPPGQMQAQSAVKTAVFEGLEPESQVMLRYHMPFNGNGHYDEPAIFRGMTDDGKARFTSPESGNAEGGYDWHAYPYVDDEYGMPDVTKWAYGSSGEPLELLSHEPSPYSKYGFVIEADTPAPWREYLQTLASDRLVALAAWKDVVAKSKRLRAEGAIDVEAFRPDVITAYIQGDHGRYYTTVQRLGSIAPGVGRQLTSTQVSGWSCDCDWGHWAWLRKRSFVGRMCSHAYALFSEMRSLDAKARRPEKGKPGRFASVNNRSAWTRSPSGGFDWVTSDLISPTAAIAKTAFGWNAYVWPDGTAQDYLDLGSFQHSGQARGAIARVVTAHMKTADYGDMDLVSPDDNSGAFPPYAAPDSISGGGYDPYSEDGNSDIQLPRGDQQGSSGIQESNTRLGSFPYFAEHDDGQDDEGPEETDEGIEEEDPADDDESLDEEIAEDEADANGSDDEGEEPTEEDDSDDDGGDGGHDEPHKRDDSEDDDEGTDNPGDESDDDHIEKESSASVAELQQQFGLTHLAGADYSLADQNRLVRESEGKTARNWAELGNVEGTHYEASTSEQPEDTLAFLF